MESEKYDVFISYSRKDSEIVDKIADEFKKYNIKCFVDRDAIGPGENYATKIAVSIPNSKIFLFIWTENSDKSNDAVNEVNLAAHAETGVIIIPFIIGDFKRYPGLDYHLNKYNGKVVETCEHKHIVELVQKIAKQLGKDTQAQQSVNEQPIAAGSLLKILSDTECKVYVDGESKGIAEADEILKIQLRSGSYLLKFVSTANPEIFKKDKFSIAKDCEELYEVNLSSLRNNVPPTPEPETTSYSRTVGVSNSVPTTPGSKPTSYTQTIAVSNIVISKKTVTPKDSNSLTDIDFIPCKKNGKYGFIDINGNELIPFKFEDAKFFSEGVARAKLGGMWGLIDIKGNSLTVFKYEEMTKFKDGLISAKLDGKWGVINKEDRHVLGFKYDEPLEFKNDKAVAKTFGRWGCINKYGKTIIPFNNDSLTDFKEGFTIARRGGTCRILNENGLNIFGKYYKDAHNFSFGLAAIKEGRNWGYINTKGELVIPFRYDEAEDFNNGFATVRLNGEEFEINTRGNRVY